MNMQVGRLEHATAGLLAPALWLFNYQSRFSTNEDRDQSGQRIESRTAVESNGAGAAIPGGTPLFLENRVENKDIPITDRNRLDGEEVSRQTFFTFDSTSNYASSVEFSTVLFHSGQDGSKRNTAGSSQQKTYLLK
jgi:extradiol dioxygenase family protein